MISTGAAFSGRGVWVTNVHQAVGVVVRLPDEGPELRFGALFDIFIARRARRDMVFGPSTDLASTVGLEAHAAWSRPSGWSLGPRASVAHGFGDAFEGIVGTVGVRARRGAWLLGADVVVPFEDPSDTSVLLGAGHTGRAPAVTLGLTLLGAWVLSGLGSLGS